MHFKYKHIISISLFLVISTSLFGQDKSAHPRVILTKKSVLEIRSELGNLPMLDKSVEKLKTNIDIVIQNPIDVPVPKDPAGGYTHKKHKENYLSMYGAGVLWQITQDKSYANFVKEMLLKYAKLYPTLGLHPVEKSYAPGKLFWQSLNEAVWMVYTSQAYDCIYDFLKPKERKKIEQDLLLPFANFLSIESPKVFNRIHNHGVWAVVAVGMAGFAMENDDLVNKAFYGIKGFPNKSGLKPGFFTQVSELFSPDGYYTEGPYYQRYAMLPYMLFAQAIENNKPEIKIFEYRNQILQKAVLTTLQLSNTDGRFFPINDAMKSMSYLAPELVTGVDIVYGQNPENHTLLAIAEEQDEIIISGAGLQVAKDIALKKTEPFIWLSREFTDGSKGDQGALGILRSGTGKNEQCVVMKYASQGMGHGHFDRLSIMYYDNGNEIIQDYGAARFVNVIHKQGGRYLPENKTWAKQTIAHNTITVDSNSQFNGNGRTANKFHAESWFFDGSNEGIKIMSAKENNAYKGVKMQRTIALIKDEQLFNNSIIVDVYRIESENEHTYDLPYYYLGHLMNSNVKYKAYTTEKKMLGAKNGYQHLWKDADGVPKDSSFQFLWLNNHRFYSIVSAVNSNSKIIYSRIGASDPEFNLRNEPAVIIRQKNKKNHVFVSTIESHGNRNPVTEITDNLNTSVKNIKTLYNNTDYTLIEIATSSDKRIALAIVNDDVDENKKHQLNINNKNYSWTGTYHLFFN